MKLDLTSRQQRTIGYCLTLLAGLLIAMVVLGVFLLMVRFLSFFSGVFLPLVSAFVLSLILKPFYQWLRVVRGLKTVWALSAVFVVFLVPLALLLYLIVTGGAMAVEAVAVSGPDYVERGEAWLASRMPTVQAWIEAKFGTGMEDAFKEQRGRLIGFAESFAGGVFQFSRGAFSRIAGLLGWVVMPIYLGYFLVLRPVPKEERRNWFSFLKDDTQEDVLYLIEQFIDIMVSFFRGQFLVALIQALMYGVGFYIVGLDFGFLVGFFMGLINVVPYLGSLVGLGVALPIALIQLDGGITTLLLVLLVFVVVQGIESYIITPKIMGDRTGLHPMAIMVAIFFWGTAFGGVIGMILAIPLTAFLVVFWRLARRKQIFQAWF